MQCMRTPIPCDIEKYEVGKGMEDGFYPYTDIIESGLVNNENLIQIKKDNGVIVCPYLRNRRGCIFIKEGDYVITDLDGTKHVCGNDKIWNRYKVIKE